MFGGISKCAKCVVQNPFEIGRFERGMAEPLDVNHPMLLDYILTAATSALRRARC
jgi:hypothetical protein